MTTQSDNGGTIARYAFETTVAMVLQDLEDSRDGILSADVTFRVSIIHTRDGDNIRIISPKDARGVILKIDLSDPDEPMTPEIRAAVVDRLLVAINKAFRQYTEPGGWIVDDHDQIGVFILSPQCTTCVVDGIVIPDIRFSGTATYVRRGPDIEIAGEEIEIDCKSGEEGDFLLFLQHYHAVKNQIGTVFQEAFAKQLKKNTLTGSVLSLE